MKETFTGFTGFIGIIAALCTTLSYIPQLLKIIKTKKTDDISLWMYILLTFGLSCWLIYGIILKDIPLISSNIISMAFSTYVLYLKIRNDL